MSAGEGELCPMQKRLEDMPISRFATAVRDTHQNDFKKPKLSGPKALNGIPSQIYGTSPASERAPPNPSQESWYSIYLPRRDERLR